MDRLSPGGGYTMTDLLQYLREGFKPRNKKLPRAGELKNKYSDFGAVDFD
jgi:hypothetical protein